MAKQEYIWLYCIRHFGRIVKHWESPSTETRHKEKRNNDSTFEILTFPIESSSAKYIDAYKAEKGETIFVCVKKKNGRTAWEQLNSSHAAKVYLLSCKNVKEAYIFSSKDMAMRF